MADPLDPATPSPEPAEGGESETVKLVRYVAETLDEAKKYGLETEVIAWALMHLSPDYEKIREALDHGAGEWLK